MKHFYLTGLAIVGFFCGTNIAMGQAITHSISEIQGELFSSPLVGQSVTTTGIVYANNVTSATSGVIGYFIQDGEGPWNGIFVFDNTQAPNIGDEVIIEGEVAEYYDATELINISFFQTVSSDNDLPEPSLATTGELSSSEEYEGCFVRVINATCVVPDADYGEALFNDGSGELKVNDYMYLPETGWVLDETYSITGAIHYTFEEYKLEPRFAEDIIAGVVNNMDELEVQRLAIFPNPSQDIIRIGTEAPGLLTLWDLSGRVVLQQNVQSIYPTIDVSMLNTGVYQVVMQAKNTRYQATFQKL
jgi:hypothetical protein